MLNRWRHAPAHSNSNPCAPNLPTHRRAVNRCYRRFPPFPQSKISKLDRFAPLSLSSARGRGNEDVARAPVTKEMWRGYPRLRSPRSGEPLSLGCHGQGRPSGFLLGLPCPCLFSVCEKKTRTSRFSKEPENLFVRGTLPGAVFSTSPRGRAVADLITPGSRRRGILHTPQSTGSVEKRENPRPEDVECGQSPPYLIASQRPGGVGSAHLYTRERSNNGLISSPTLLESPPSDSGRRSRHRSTIQTCRNRPTACHDSGHRMEVCTTRAASRLPEALI